MNVESKYSEIRQSTLNDLREKATNRAYKSYLHSLELVATRMFVNQRIQFSFPVTAIIGPNGSGKSTILGSCASIYAPSNARRYFRKSRFGDENMSDWMLKYELVDKSLSSKGFVKGELHYVSNKWSNSVTCKRHVEYIGLNRTVPVHQGNYFKNTNVLTVDQSVNGRPELVVNEIDTGIESIRREAERILGKSFENLRHFDISISIEKIRRNKMARSQGVRAEPIRKRTTSKQTMFVMSSGESTYSEFNFGSGEASVIRSVSIIETLPESSLLIPSR